MRCIKRCRTSRSTYIWVGTWFLGTRSSLLCVLFFNDIILTNDYSISVYLIYSNLCLIPRQKDPAHSSNPNRSLFTGNSTWNFLLELKVSSRPLPLLLSSVRKVVLHFGTRFTCRTTTLSFMCTSTWYKYLILIYNIRHSKTTFQDSIYLLCWFLYTILLTIVTFPTTRLSLWTSYLFSSVWEIYIQLLNRIKHSLTYNSHSFFLLNFY